MFNGTRHTSPTLTAARAATPCETSYKPALLGIIFVVGFVNLLNPPIPNAMATRPAMRIEPELAPSRLKYCL